MKKTLLVLCVILAWLTLPEAQAATYAYRNDVFFPYDTPSGAATTLTWHAGTKGSINLAPACTSYPLGDDDWADITFPAGFTFTFAGVAQSAVRVYSNGILVFGTDTSGQWRTYTNATLPYNTALGSYGTGCPGGALSNAIVGYWTDIIAGTAQDSTNNPVTGASVQYELLGAAPSRRLVISWVNVQLYTNTGTAVRYNFQILLYESPAGGLNSNFKYKYTTGSSTGSAATVGVQVGAADSTLYSINQAFIDPVAGSAVLWYPANQLAGKSAEYRFDEGSWNGTAGEVKDTSGSGMDAVKVGNASNIAAGKLCRGGSIPANTLNTTIDAVATPITPASVGSIDFWYKSAVAWNAANSDAMLFDATTVIARPYYLMKTTAGKLKFTVTDSTGTIFTVTENTAQSFAANTWEHVGVSWNMRPGTNQTLFQIFLNGVVVPSTTVAAPVPNPVPTAPRTTSSGTITPLSTLYIGDNRTSGVTPSGGSPNSANGSIDEVYIYTTEINASQAAADMNLTRTTCTTMDHFHIVHSGSVVNCGNPATVTIEAHDASHALFSLAGTTLSLSSNTTSPPPSATSHANWSNVVGGAINPVTNLGNGSATYTFSNESRITLGITDTTIESININLVSGAFTEHTGAAAVCGASDFTFGTVCDADLSFDQAGFRFLDSSGNNIGNQIAGTASGNYYLQAVKTICTTGTCTGVCTSVFPSGTAVNIDLSSECVNPVSCKAGQAVTFTPGPGAGAAGTIGANNSGTVTAGTGTYTTRSLTFNTVAPNPLPSVPFTVNYSDAGQIRLWARYIGSTSTVSGNSASYVVKPHHFDLSAIQQTAAPNLANPAAVNATGAKFVKAGEIFSVTVTARNAANAATPNFGQENPSESVKLTPTLATGLGLVSNPAISGSFGTFTNGVATGTAFSWPEVGIITLTPSISSGNYLASAGGAGDTSGTTSGNVGRFYAAQFGLSAGSINNRADLCPDPPAVQPAGCPSTFTYMGEKMDAVFTLTAQAVGGTATQNYNYSVTAANNFAKLNPTLTGNPLVFGAIDTTAPRTPLSARLDTSLTATGNFVNGSANISAPLAITRGASGDGPYTALNISIAPVDGDGAAMAAYDLDVTHPVSATLDHTKVASTEVRYGLIKISNAYGSELLPLTLTAMAQYYTANGWVNSITDSITSMTLAATYPVGAGTTTVTPTNGKLSGGQMNINLAKPSAGAGVATVTPTAAPGYLPVTPGTATFGVYKGTSEFIYMREAY